MKIREEKYWLNSTNLKSQSGRNRSNVRSSLSVKQVLTHSSLTCDFLIPKTTFHFAIGRAYVQIWPFDSGRATSENRRIGLRIFLCAFRCRRECMRVMLHISRKHGLRKVGRTYWWVVTLKKRCENCGAESSGPCGAGKLATNITGFRAKLCLLCLRKATLSLAIRSG